MFSVLKEMFCYLFKRNKFPKCGDKVKVNCFKWPEHKDKVCEVVKTGLWNKGERALTVRLPNGDLLDRVRVSNVTVI